jgi:tol-pal system protein YbgF
MSRPLLLIAALTVLALSLSACATQQDAINLQEQLNQQAAEQRKLSGRVAELEKNLNIAIKALRQEISRTSGPVRSKQADLWATIEQMRKEVGEAQGQLEELARRTGQAAESAGLARELEETREEVADIRMALENQLALQIEGPAAAAPPGAAVTGTPAEAGNGQAAGRDVSEQTAQTLYSRALDTFKAKEYDKAQEMWAEFVRNFPEHRLVPNAIFWQGESFYQMGDYARAILSYQEVIDKHKESNKYPAALLKQGISFSRIGKSNASKLVLQELMDKFPDSAEAERARAILEGLES